MMYDGEAKVAAGCSANLTICSLRPGAVPLWFEVPDEVADDFVISAILVGKDCHLVTTAALPAALFAQSAPKDEFFLDLVPNVPENTVGISITNISNRDSRFTFNLVSEHNTEYQVTSRKLARYRRALACGLGFLKIAPEGLSTLTVQPSASLVPDRLFVSKKVLEEVEIRGVYVRPWNDGRPTGAFSYLPERYLTPDNLSGDGVITFRPDSAFASEVVGPESCFTLHLRNKTDHPVFFTGAILGAKPL